ncbi:transcriptional regulator [Planotetraspora silvatica]|uniref:Transcriptional regulator n=1 Tax=Planotetraspora silvatica TaxID=234614 RepID=A0A8J3UTM5_9ACTN|nr:transcriptional regulator [Planotetraspora silvatica]
MRRVEVAMLAGVSVDYYTRLEQGRECHPSDQVLRALARALWFDVDATEHLHELARGEPRKRRTADRVEEVNPIVLRFVEGCDHVPALVVNGRFDVLARNQMAEALYAGLEHGDNLVRLAFLEPEARAFYLDWEHHSLVKVAHLRAAAGADLDDPALVELIEELGAASEDFRRMWARHEVRALTGSFIRVRHRDVGDLFLSYEMFTVESSRPHQIIVLAAEPGSPSEKALARLGTHSR